MTPNDAGASSSKIDPTSSKDDPARSKNDVEELSTEPTGFSSCSAPEGVSSGPGIDRRTIALLLLVLAVGLGLRLLGLGTSFWVDEVDTLLYSIRLPVRALITSYPSENQHPLYSLLAHGCIAMFGEHEWSVRLPAVLLGVASLAAIYRLGAQVLDARRGLLAALLLAVSSHHVWFSQNARGYTGLLLFTTLATSEFWTLVHSSRLAAQGSARNPGRGSPRAVAVRYTLWFALATYTHLTALFAFAGHGIAWLGLKWVEKHGPWPAPERTPSSVPDLPTPPKARGLALIAMFAGGLLSLLLYWPMRADVIAAFTSRAQQTSASVKRVEEWTRPVWALEQIRNSVGGGIGTVIALTAIAVLASVGFLSFWKHRRRLFLAMNLAGLPLALIFLLALERHLYPRFFFFEVGFLALLVVQGALASGAWVSCYIPGCRERRAGLLGTATVMLVAAALALSLETVYACPKQDFVSARDLVEAEAAPGDAKVAVGPARIALTKYYAPAWKEALSADELAAIRAGASRTWLVYTLPDQLRSARPDLFEAVQRDFVPVQEFPGSLSGGTVYVLRSR